MLNVIKLRQLSKGQKYFIMMDIFVCGLLFCVDGVAFNLISTPLLGNDLISYATLALAIVLTMITLPIAIKDVRQGLSIEMQKSDIVRAGVESNKQPTIVLPPAIIKENTKKVDYEDKDNEPTKVIHQTVPAPKSFNKRIFFVATIIIVVGLLFFADGVAFGFIALPEFSMYAAIAGAVALTAITIAIALKDKLRRSLPKTQKQGEIQQKQAEEQQKPIEEPKKQDEDVAVKESNKAPGTFVGPFYIRKSANTVEPDLAKQENPPTKPFIMQPTKVICPACRKEFNVPFFEGNLIVDFGPPKQSNLTKVCPHCQTPVRLKRNGVADGEIWKE